VIEEVRTKKGRLVGKLNVEESSFEIKDGKRITRIEIPPCGLRLHYSHGGITEKIHIKPYNDKPQKA